MNFFQKLGDCPTMGAKSCVGFELFTFDSRDNSLNRVV